MNKIKDLYKKFESTVSNVKFAVVIISLFTIALVYGVLMESYHGTDFANRMVYKSPWFMFIELLMFISIFMATVVRLPFKKRLSGFYTIHAGLIILFIGSFFTYINGIDGSIQLLPNTPAHKIVVNEDLLQINFTTKAYTVTLPYTPFEKNLNLELNGVKILKFLPSAEKKTNWIKHKSHNREQHSSSYQLFNDNMSQEFTLSLSPRSDFKSMLRMGLLNLHYMPKVLLPCFKKESKSGYILWNLITGECFTAEEKKLNIGKTDKGNEFVLLKQGKEYLKFFPNFSPVPVHDDLTKIHNSPFRILSKKIFEEKPNLFLFGNDISFYHKRKKNWVVKPAKDQVVKLPWMGFKLRLIRHSSELVPVESPVYVRPVQDNGKIISGDTKAVLVEYKKQQYWVMSDAPLELSNGKDKIRFIITPKEIQIPYQITLDKFKMNTNPGTNDPASYESFVQVLDGRTQEGIIKSHVFMNNPLKYDGFTYYQASYFPIGPEQYGSVLSVNYDPGRFFKYLGSLFIVLGSIWHYLLNRRKKKKV